VTFGAVRPFFAGRLDALGFSEWPDGFNTENIPSTILDNSYHLEVGEIRGESNGPTNYVFSMPLVIRIFTKGYRDPGSQIDAALDIGNVVLEDLLDPAVRNAQNDLKDIRPTSVQVLPLAASNDNQVITQISLEVYMMYCFA
jgi:hypothetical protein